MPEYFEEKKFVSPLGGDWRSYLAGRMIDEGWKAFPLERPRDLMMLALSGAHVYGNPKPDSDVDLRGIHMIELQSYLGLRDWRGDTVEWTEDVAETKYDIVTHELVKAVNLLFKGNGNILEMMMTELRVADPHLEMGILRYVPDILNTRFASHYKGLGEHMRHHLMRKGEGTDWYRKRVFYGYRSVLCGWFLMDEGRLEPNLYKLAEEYGINIEMRMAQSWDEVGADLAKMIEVLEEKRETSALPENVPEKIRDRIENGIFAIRML